jgi:hypothetical protein
MFLYGVFCIIYKQHVDNVSVKKHRKKTVKILIENWLVRFIQQEMWILHAKLLVKHFKNMYRDLFCTKFDLNNYKYYDARL